MVISFLLVRLGETTAFPLSKFCKPRLGFVLKRLPIFLSLLVEKVKTTRSSMHCQVRLLLQIETPIVFNVAPLGNRAAVL